MRCLVIMLTILAATQMVAADKPTSLSDARDAVDANVRSSEGKKFDEQFGADFIQRHLDPFHDCKGTAAGDMRDFWMLLKLDKEGTAREILLYPTTKLASCATGKLLNDKFLPPPRPDYWVSVFMKFSH